jgi:replicative DNA helicase
MSDQGGISQPEKIAPHSIEAEEAVLGSILINPDALFEVAAFLQGSDFFIVRNGWVWEAVLAVHERGEAIDSLTVIDALRKRGQLDSIGGSAYITFLINNTPTHIHAETYGRIVERAAIRRRLLAAASNIAQTALEENAVVEEVADHAYIALDAATSRTRSGAATTFEELAKVGFSRAWEYKYEPADLRGWETGIKPLDWAFGGLQSDDFFVITGQPGSGKSTLLMQILLKLAEQGPGVLFPTEMSGDLLIDRLACFVLGLNYKDFRAGRIQVDDKALAAVYERFAKLPITVYNHASPTPQQIKSFTRGLARQGKAKWVAVDGINDIEVPGEVYERTSSAVDALYNIAYSGILTVATCHVNREPTRRGSKAPTMFDTLGGSKVAQRATRFIAIHRAAYDIKTGLAKHRAGQSVDDELTWLHIGKDRHTGAVGKKLKMKFMQTKYGCGYFPADTENEPPPVRVTTAPVPFYGEREDGDE